MKPVKPLTLREALKEILTENELKEARTSYDIVGDILILEIPECLRYKESEIGIVALSLHKNVNTVLRKEDAHEGRFRTQKFKFLAGENKRVTEYRENGCRLIVDVEKVYFSPRLAHERERIARLVNEGEDVLVMFSGCNPYGIVAAKNARPRKVVGIEWNPEGTRLAKENAAINKLSNVETIYGDVREEAQKLKNQFDRVLMCLPKSSEEYLSIAIPCVMSGGMLHVYKFLHNSLISEFEGVIANECRKAGRKCKILNVIVCGQHAPYVERYCFDVRIG